MEAACPEDPRLVRAWGFYNWANHGWAAPVAAVLVGPWMLALATKAVGKHGILIAVGPLHLRAEAFPSAMVAVAAILQLAVLPVVGVAADAVSTKQRWLAGACFSGSAISALLALTSGSEWLLAGVLFLVGSLIEGVSDLIWNGMLPRLAGPGRSDAVSARGTGIGYLGAGVLLAANLGFIDLHDTFGLTKSVAVRICFVIAGAWWAGFGTWAIRGLRALPLAARTSSSRPPTWWSHVRAVRSELAILRSMPQTFRFVLAYLCFSDAVSAVISLASVFLTHQLFDDNASRASTFLFELILMVQFVAVVGAAAFTRLAARVGSKRATVISLVMWCGVITFAYAVLDNETDAVLMGVVVGLGLGGTISLSRSLFARMVPPGREAAFFSLYEVCSQGTAWMAPLIFTIVVNATGSFRDAVLSLVILLVAGLILLLRTDTEEAFREAARLPTGMGGNVR